jgi:putative DNA primase/helicase
MTDSVLIDFVKQAREKRESIDDPVTEDAAALAFTERYRDMLRFDHDIGKWFVWTDIHWQCERTGLAFSWARELARELAKAEPNKVRLISSKTSFAGGVERFARTDRTFAVTSDIWDRNHYLLGTAGGTVDLHTGEIRQAVPEDFITKVTAVAPSDKPECPRWLQFMREATNNDEGLIAFLQQFSGYMLTGDTKEHSLLFIHGGGGNGKSVYQNTLAGILGDYAKTAAMETFTASSMDKHPTDLAMLHGARLVSASETEEGRAWAESRIKQLTGGDKISARFMRQDFFEFTPQFKLLLIGNHKPTLRNVDDAARRRFNIVPFIHKPPTPDRDLESKLRAEWPGILRWMIDGCLIWQAEGIKRPDIVIETTKEYFSEQDLLGQWIDELLEKTSPAESKMLGTKAYESFVYFAKQAGEHTPGDIKWFHEQMEQHGFVRTKSHGDRVYRGVRFKSEYL